MLALTRIDGQFAWLSPQSAIPALSPVCVPACVECASPSMQQFVVWLVLADDQIGVLVVGPILVEVMNRVRDGKRLSERRFGYDDVFKHVAVACARVIWAIKTHVPAG